MSWVEADTSNLLTWLAVSKQALAMYSLDFKVEAGASYLLTWLAGSKQALVIYSPD